MHIANADNQRIVHILKGFFYNAVILHILYTSEFYSELSPACAKWTIVKSSMHAMEKNSV